LALTTMHANLSRAMHQLNGDYAQWWNWRHDCAGHVFQARFFAQVVQDDGYLANVCRYVVLNPVRAGMVSAPDDWPWSSYRAMVGIAACPPFLDAGPLRDRVTSDAPDDSPRRFLQLVHGDDGPTEPLSRDTILGDDSFVARFRRFRRRAGPEIPRFDGRRSLPAIFEGAVTRTARDEAVMIAVRERYALAEIARFLEVHPSTVSKIVNLPAARRSAPAV
jgi:hypothetical protein